MATLPNNILEVVQTYNKVNLAYLQNLNCFYHTANKRFKDYKKANPANLGDTILFEKTYRSYSKADLVISFDGIEQRPQALVVDTPASSGVDVSGQQIIFNNIDEYMDRIGRAAIEELGAQMESGIAQVAVQYPYRFFGNGVTAPNSFGTLAQMLAQFRNFGASRNMTRGYLSDIITPQIVDKGLNQFVGGRNERMANSWELGSFGRCEWYESNLLATHIAGSEGQAGTTLTVVSTTLDSNGNVIAITFSGTAGANDPNSVLLYDRFQFVDNVTGFQNVRFLTWIGHKVSQCPVQFKSTANATSTAGSQVTVFIDIPLQVAAGKNQNINTPIVPGMKCTVLPSHRAGLLQSGDQFYVANPPLPDERPFDSSSMVDMETGASIRMTTGALAFQNQWGTSWSLIYGSTLVPENSMAVIYPL